MDESAHTSPPRKLNSSTILARLIILLMALAAVIFLFRNYRQMSAASRASLAKNATMIVGVTRAQLLAAHGEPTSIIPPGEIIENRMYHVNEQNTGSGEVWFYDEFPVMILYIIYFDENGICTKVRRLET